MAEKMFNQKTSYGLAILSGILLLLSYPPFKFGGFLAWISLVPLLIAIYYEMQLKRMGRLITIASLGFSLMLIWAAWWFSELLTLVTFVWPEAPITLLRTLVFILILPYILYSLKDIYGWWWNYWKPKNFPSKNLQYLHLPSFLQIFVLPLILTSFEFLVMNIPGLMRGGGIYGLFSIAKTQWANPSIMQLASLVGMYGITFLIVLVNCAVAYTVIHYKETKQIFKPTIAVLCVFALIFSYGWISIPREVAGDVTVAVIQTPPMEGEDTSALYLNLGEKALKYSPQIIIWPGLIFEGVFIKSRENFSQDQNVYLMGMSTLEEIGYGVISPDGGISIDYFGYHMFTILGIL